MVTFLLVIIFVQAAFHVAMARMATRSKIAAEERTKETEEAMRLVRALLPIAQFAIAEVDTGAAHWPVKHLANAALILMHGQLPLEGHERELAIAFGEYMPKPRPPRETPPPSISPTDAIYMRNVLTGKELPMGAKVQFGERK